MNLFKTFWHKHSDTYWRTKKASIHTGQRIITTTSSSCWFATRQMQMPVVPQAARQTSSCFASPCISRDEKSHIFSACWHDQTTLQHTLRHPQLHTVYCDFSPLMETQWKKLDSLQLTYRTNYTIQRIPMCLFDSHFKYISRSPMQKCRVWSMSLWSMRRGKVHK